MTSARPQLQRLRYYAFLPAASFYNPITANAAVEGLAKEHCTRPMMGSGIFASPRVETDIRELSEQRGDFFNIRHW